MELKIIKSFSLDDWFKYAEHTDDTRKVKNVAVHSDRRKFLKLAGMAGLGASFAGVSNLLLPEKAAAGCFVDYYGTTWCDPYTIWYYRYYQQQLQAQYGALLLAMLNQLLLESSYLHVEQPSVGRLNLVNQDYQESSGNLALTVVDSRSLDEVEDQKTTSYTLPPRSVHTVAFNDGPSGQYSGNKQFTAWTAKSNKSAPLTVYA